MSAIAAHAHDHAATDHAEVPANGSFLPRPRNAASFSALSFVLACGTAPVAAFGLSIGLKVMASTDPTLGAWMAVAVLAAWVPVTAAAIYFSHDRDEWS